MESHWLALQAEPGLQSLLQSRGQTGSAEACRRVQHPVGPAVRAKAPDFTEQGQAIPAVSCPNS